MVWMFQRSSEGKEGHMQHTCGKTSLIQRVLHWRLPRSPHTQYHYYEICADDMKVVLYLWATAVKGGMENMSSIKFQAS
jgi:hypothetical protein